MTWNEKALFTFGREKEGRCDEKEQRNQQQRTRQLHVVGQLAGRSTEQQQRCVSGNGLSSTEALSSGSASLSGLRPTDACGPFIRIHSRDRDVRDHMVEFPMFLLVEIVCSQRWDLESNDIDVSIFTHF